MVKSISFMAISTFFLALMAIMAFPIFASEAGRNQKENRSYGSEDLRKHFDKVFLEWQEHLDKPEVRFQSITEPYIDNPPFKAIVAMGEPALPLIVEKIENGKATGWSQMEFFLWHAMRDITGVNFDTGEVVAAQDMAEKYVNWWRQHMKDQVDRESSK